MLQNINKCGIIGCGFVGASTAFTLAKEGLFSEIVLLDIDEKKARGEALDIAHGMPFGFPVKIYAGKYSDLAECSLIIIAAGANQKEGETRLELVEKNAAIFRQIIPKVTQINQDCILLILSNPVDILTHITLELSGFPPNRVIGSGTVLDTARFKFLLGDHFGVDMRNIHAFIIGEHGDSEIAAWSSANVSGIPLNDFCEMRGHYQHEKSTKEIAEGVRNSAYEIIERKRATYYGVAMAVKRICEVIVRDEKSVLPVSVRMHGEQGIFDVVLSMPCIVGKDGIETKVPLQLNEEEQEKLMESAKVLKGILETITF